MENGKYKIVTYGCALNIHESEKLAGILHKLGFTETDNNEDANVIIFNTCAIRKGAEDRAFGNIGALKRLKKSRKDLIIAVCGCMTQKIETAKELKQKLPFVDIIFGTYNVCEFEKYLNNYVVHKKSIIEVLDKPLKMEENVDMYRTSGYNAYINIMQGCNNFCSYCIVPYVRGRERSRNFDEIVCEAKHLINDGYKTITLLGQNVNSYGNDLNDKNFTFANLLTTIANLEGDFRLKFMTSHPKDLTIDVVQAIAKCNRISKAVHLPVQSGSNDILNSMNRKYTVEKYLSQIKMIRDNIPNATISSDFIVGFPGETEEDFNKTVELVNQVKFSQIFTYMYSRRSGTVADKMENQVPFEIKNKRVNQLLNLQKEITSHEDEKSVGKEYVCIINRIEKGFAIAVNDCNKTIMIKDYNHVRVADFVNVIVTEIKNKKLFGKII